MACECAMTRKSSAMNTTSATVRAAPMLRTRRSRNHCEHQRNGKQLPHTRMDAASQQKFRNFLPQHGSKHRCPTIRCGKTFKICTI
jgi:hypothetical protein